MEAWHLLTVFANTVKIVVVEEEEAAVEYCKVKNGSARCARTLPFEKRKYVSGNSEGPRTYNNKFSHIVFLTCLSFSVQLLPHLVSVTAQTTEAERQLGCFVYHRMFLLHHSGRFLKVTLHRLSFTRVVRLSCIPLLGTSPNKTQGDLPIKCTLSGMIMNNQSLAVSDTYHHATHCSRAASPNPGSLLDLDNQLSLSIGVIIPHPLGPYQ